MNRRKTSIAILIIIIILLLLGLGYLFWKAYQPAIKAQIPKIEQQVKDQTETNKTVVNQLETQKNSNAPKASDEEIAKANLIKLSESFAERIGSYSNQSNFNNVTDLKILMTASMQKWADNYVAQAIKDNKNPEVYQGFITKAISTEVKSFDASNGKAEISVSTQRTEESADGKISTPYYQDILIDFVKPGDSWLVDGAYWQKK